MNDIEPAKKSVSWCGAARALLRILAGYLAACIGAGLTIIFCYLFTIPLVEGRPALGDLGFIARGYGYFAAIASAIVLTLTVIPAGAFILWSEFTAEIRSGVHIIGGCLISVLGTGLFACLLGSDRDELLTRSAALLPILVAGALAGFIYWRISGKYAGRWS